MVLGFGIRDPGCGKNLFRIPDQGSKRHWIPDPDPQHWLLGISLGPWRSMSIFF